MEWLLSFCDSVVEPAPLVRKYSGGGTVSSWGLQSDASMMIFCILGEINTSPVAYLETTELGIDVDDFDLNPRKRMNVDCTPKAKELGIDVDDFDLNPRKRMNVDCTPKAKHGSRVIAGVCNKTVLIFAGDTRVTKETKKENGELIITNDEKSKLMVSCKGLVAAYVGDEGLWRDVCALVKDEYAKSKTPPDMNKLAKTIFADLQNKNFRTGDHGIDLVLGFHDESGLAKMIRITQNNPIDLLLSDDDVPSGCGEVWDGSRGSCFIVLGGGFRVTQNRLTTRWKKTLTVSQASALARSEVISSAMLFECIGGNVQEAQLHPGKGLICDTCSILESYLASFKNDEPGFEQNVIFCFRDQDDKNNPITSFQIAKHIVGKTKLQMRPGFQHFGSMTNKKSGKVVFVDRLVFDSQEDAQRVLARVNEVRMCGGPLESGMRHSKLRTTPLSLIIPTYQFVSQLLTKYKFGKCEVK